MAVIELYPIIAVFLFTVAICGAVYAGLELGYRPMHRRMRDLAVRIRVTEGLYEEPDQVGDLVTAISNKAGYDDEAIQSGANLLLTFTNIRNEAGKGNDIFNQSTRILTDMSTAMGTEPKQAAIQLGKALNDPIKGISALSRVGVTFTDGQKKTIKSLVDGGKTMQAQKIILKELNSEFGGSAAAQARMPSPSARPAPRVTCSRSRW